MAVAKFCGFGAKRSAEILIKIFLFGLLSTQAQAASRTPLVVAGQSQIAPIIQQVPLTGTVTAAQTARLSAQVSGQVKSLNVDEGSHVKAGEVLLTLDSELEQLTLDATRASTRQAVAELADARRRYQDAQVLSRQRSIAANERELLKAEISIDEATLARRQAEEKKQQALLARYRVTAPFAGVISAKNTETGEWVNPGSAVLTLVATDKLRIDFRVAQEYFPRIDEQTQVSVSFDAMPEQRYPAHIIASVPVSDPSARTFLLRAELDQQDLKITPGMSVHGMLQLNTGQQGVVVPRDALLRYPDGRITVWQIEQQGEQNIVRERLVQIGHSFDGQVAILEGLEAGVTLVLEGNESLQEGQAVDIHQAAAQPR